MPAPIAPPLDAFDPEADIVMPPPVEPPLPPDFEVVPGPAVVAPPSPPEQEAPPPIDLLGRQPAPVTGPDVTIARGNDRLRNLGQARIDAEREGALAADELRQAAADYQAAKTPAEQAKAMQRAEQAKQRIQGAGVTAQAAGLAVEREQAAQAAAIDSAISNERTARMAEAAQVLDARATETAARVAEAQAERARAQERRAAREKEYAALLDRGPQDTGATWTAAIGMIGEMWSAFAQRRQPNLGVWLDRGLQQAKESHAGDLEAMRARIGAEDQVIEDAALEIAQRQADDLAFEQAYLAKLDRDLALFAAQKGQTPEGMAAEEARRRVQAEQQARFATAQAAAEKAERENAKAAAEVRKTTAEAALLERKLAGGTGAAAGKTFGARTNISEDALIDPITGVVLGESRFQDRGKVREDQQTVNDFTTSLRDVEQYIGLLTKVGRTYQGLGRSAVKDEDLGRLEQLYNDLFMKTQRALTGAAATEQEQERIAKIIPGPKSYSDFGSWQPDDVLRQYRDRMATSYEDFLGSRLKTGSTLIRSEKGETLPTSPTYGFKISQGQTPVETKASRIITDLARKHEGNPAAAYRDTLLLQERQRNPELGEVEIARRVQMREDEQDPFKQRVDAYWRDALDSEGADRSEITTALKDARDALDAVGDAQRVEYLDAALKQIEAGVTPRQFRASRPLRKDPRARFPLGGE
jgi:hypothetical protein